jgi:RNA polymerase sigma factor for flagellar operon FliA
MTEDELDLWRRHRQRDEAARKELILSYLPLVDLLAKRIARIAGWANWEDLRQEGVFGLFHALERFDPNRAVQFKSFAEHFIRGAIFNSSELTRDLARQQKENYRKFQRAEAELTQKLERLPTREEVAAQTGLTIEQIHNAIDAMGIAFAGEFSAAEELTELPDMQTTKPDKAALMQQELSRLSDREQEIIGLYYWEGLQDKEIAERLSGTTESIRKLRQRTLKKLRKRLGGNRKGGQDEDK